MESEDFLDLDQTSQNLDIDFDISELSLNIVDVTTLPDFKYPAMLITGVLFQDTLKVLKTKARESYRSVDVWLDMEDGSSPENIGTLPMDMEVFLIMRYLNVRVTLYLSPDNVETLDLAQPDVLEKFM